MKVLIISPQFRPLVGGYERAAERLAIALAKRGHEVTVLAERRESGWPRAEMQAGFKIHRIWCVYRRGMHLWTTVVSLAAFLLRYGRHHDVWHVQQYGVHAVVAAATSTILQRPIIVRTTSTGKLGINEAIASLPMHALAKRLLRRANAFIALTEEMRKEVESFGVVSNKIHLIGNGVDVAQFHERSCDERIALRARLGLSPKKAVLFSGRLSSQKAPRDLLQAWGMLQAALGAEWQLVLVGDGPLLGELRQQVVALGLTASVTFVGYQDEIDLWMGAADIFVQCSLTEGMSNALLEAMASGLPIVTTEVSGSKALVSETEAGIVVPVSAVADLGRAIHRLALDPVLRSEMGRLGRKIIVERYSIDTVARRHEELYSFLLAPRERRPA